MGDRREHLRAVLDEVLQLGLHGVEREDRLADLVGADRLDGRRAKVHAKPPRTQGELLQGLARRRVAIKATRTVDNSTRPITIRLRGPSSSPQLRETEENISQEPSLIWISNA